MSQRRRFLIDPKVQWAIIRHMTLHWSLTILALLAIGIGVQVVYSPSDLTVWNAIGRSVGAQAPLLCLMFMLYPVYVWDIIKLSHRFSGPMLRFRRTLNELAEGGDSAPIKFRPGDFWHDAAEDFNRFYHEHIELKKRCEELQNELRVVSEAAGKLESAELST